MALISSQYYIPGTVPLLYCSACLDIALKKSEKAKEVYAMIVESYYEPGMLAILQELQRHLPSGKEELEIFKDESKRGAEAAKKANRKWQPDTAFLSGFIKRVAVRGFGRFKWYWFNLRMRKSPEFNRLLGMYDDLIKVAFNREDDQEKHQYKVTLNSSEFLIPMIQFKTYADFLKVAVRKEKGKALLKVGSKYHDLSPLLPGNRATRRGRVFTKAYKEAEYRLLHDDKITKVAERWYGCRVVYSGVTEYCDQMAFKGKTRVPDDPSNISNEIKECDKAMGYPRSK
jgi:hypothetical protein